MIDWLATRNGRLAAFFLLYVTEGLPLGFTAVFVATLMRREGVTPAVIGGFVASLYLPWSFKFVAGPFVDLFRSRRFGPRRTWIVLTQLAMTFSLMSLALFNAYGGVDVTDVALFTTIVVISNIFGAIQDVAIDALAVDTLHESERGLANGLMFAGASIGQALGGSGALFLLKYVGFVGATLSVGGWLLGVLVVVSLWLKERPVASTADDRAADDRAADDRTADAGDASFRQALVQVVDYLVTAFRAFLGSRPNGVSVALVLIPAAGLIFSFLLLPWLAVLVGGPNRDLAAISVVPILVFAVLCAAGGIVAPFFGASRSLLGLALALLPAGGMALGLSLQSNLAVELGMSDDAIAGLNVVSTVVFAVFCAAGGWISDFFGRVRSLAVFIALTAIPTLLFASLLWRAGWIMPVEMTQADRPTAPDWLISGLWAATIVFNMANGLMYGTRSAFFMDFCEPKVAATQFTAYMAMMNLTISYSAFWQGHAAEAIGYPATLTIDAGFGLVCLAVLALVPLTRNPQKRTPSTPVETTCPACGTEVPAGAAGCPMCGKPLRVGR